MKDSSVNEHQSFSQDHAYSRADVADLASVVAAENPGKRLLVNVTIGHRSLAKRQAIVSQSIGVFFMVAIYIAERAVPSIALEKLNFWALLGVINMVIRGGLFYKVFAPLPAEMARSSVLRVLPLLIVLIGAAHWIWTIQLFVGAQLTPTVLVLFVGFLAITIAVMGMWPTVPIAAVLYVGTTWPPYFFRAYETGLMPVSVLAMLALGVAAVLWACIYLEINQVTSILTRSDEVELLVAKLNETNQELTSANQQLDRMHVEAASALETRSMFFTSASHDFRQRLHAMKLLSHSALGACRAWGAEARLGPSEDSFCRVCRPIAEAMGQEAAEKWTAAAQLQPALPKPDSLLEHASASCNAVQASLKRLTESVEEVERYVTDVLDFARLESDSNAPKRTVVTLQKVFQELDLTFEDVAAERGVDLQFRATDVCLITDQVMLLRILENLISNAIKFTSGRVLVAARRRDGGVALQVWDQGCGIPLDAQRLIFAPFHQGKNPSNNAGSRQGVGLGLAVVQRFVDSLGYQVLVKSKVGIGSVLTVLIPAADVEQVAQFNRG